MKRRHVIGNWKMHGRPDEARDLVRGLHAVAADAAPLVTTVVCPPFPLLPIVVAAAGGSALHVGAQDCHHQVSGAFTGDTSATLLADVGCRYVIVGHSERRRDHAETDALIAAKATAAVAAGLTPVICVGERRDERESGSTTDVITGQIGTILAEAGAGVVGQSLVAYEPVWAIGTGLAATPEQAQDVHATIRAMLMAAAADTVILYGGSVTAANAAELFACPDIDGALVGGASLTVETFANIVRACAAIGGDPA